jgi:hypothetical protein
MTRTLVIFVVQESKWSLPFSQKLHRSGFYSLRAANRKVAGAYLFLDRPMETEKSTVADRDLEPLSQLVLAIQGTSGSVCVQVPHVRSFNPCTPVYKTELIV